MSASANAWSGCETIGEHVDDRHLGAVGVERCGGPHDRGVVEDPSGDHRVVPGHDPHDVLDGFAGVEADLLAPGVDRVTAELHDRHLHRVPGPVRRLLEDQRGSLALERSAERLDRLFGQIEDRGDLGSAEVGDVEQVTGHPPASWS